MESTGGHVELYVRSLAPEGSSESQEAVVEALAALRAGGRIEEYELFVWGARAPTGGPTARSCAGQWVLERVDRFRGWAEREQATLPGLFDPCESGTLVEDCRAAITLPSLLLVERRGEEVDCVTPHLRDGRLHTVSERLEELAVGEPLEKQPLEARS